MRDRERAVSGQDGQLAMFKANLEAGVVAPLDQGCEDMGKRGNRTEIMERPRGCGEPRGWRGAVPSRSAFVILYLDTIASKRDNSSVLVAFVTCRSA